MLEVAGEIIPNLPFLATGDKICQDWQRLKLPNLGVAKDGINASPKIAKFGNFWTCSNLAFLSPRHTSRNDKTWFTQTRNGNI